MTPLAGIYTKVWILIYRPNTAIAVAEKAASTEFNAATNRDGRDIIIAEGIPTV